MKSKSIFTLIVLISLLTAVSIAPIHANPRPQSSLQPITYDNIPDLSVLAVLTHPDNSRLSGMSFYGDNRLITAASDGLIRIWDIDPASPDFGTEVDTILPDSEICPESCFLGRMAVFEDTLAVSTSFGVIGFYDLLTGELIAEQGIPDIYGITAIALSPNGKQLYATHGDGRLLVGNTADTETVQLYQQDEPLLALAITSNGDLLAIAGGHYLTEPPQSTVNVWQTTPEGINLLYAIEDHERPVAALAFSPDGSLLASGDGDEFTEFPTIRLTDTQNEGALIALITIETDFDNNVAFPANIAFSPDGSLMFVSMFFSNTIVFETDSLSGDLDLSTATYQTIPYEGRAMLLSPDASLWITYGYSNTVEIWGIPNSPQ